MEPPPLAEQAAPEDPVEALLERQRREIRELKSQVQKIKHAVPKGDKRRQKDAALEIAALEAALNDRHARELREAKAAAAVARAAPAPAAAGAAPATTAAPAAGPTPVSEAADATSDAVGAIGLDDDDDAAVDVAAPGARRVTKASKRRVRASTRGRLGLAEKELTLVAGRWHTLAPLGHAVRAHRTARPSERTKCAAKRPPRLRPSRTCRPWKTQRWPQCWRAWAFGLR